MVRRVVEIGPPATPIRWLATRGAIARSDEGREFVDDVLGELAAHRLSLPAWARFFVRSLLRSVDQVRIRPAAATEVTAIHLLAWRATGSRRWAFASWLLCITHLGLLGERSTLGWPNRLTLLRELLPALCPDSRWTSLVALATDFADGRLARRGNESGFGAFADPLADGVFWSWFALRFEPSRVFRARPRHRLPETDRTPLRICRCADLADSPRAAFGRTLSGSGRARRTWSRARDIPGVCLERRNLSQSVGAAVVVGTILFFINQADVVFSGRATTATWIRIGLSYLVPLLVSNYGVVIGSRSGPG